MVIIKTDQTPLKVTNSRIPKWVLNTYECLRIEYNSVTMPKNALRICYELTTIPWNRDFVAKTLNSLKRFKTYATNSRLLKICKSWLRIYTNQLRTSRTVYYSATKSKIYKFVAVRGIRGPCGILALTGISLVQRVKINELTRHKRVDPSPRWVLVGAMASSGDHRSNIWLRGCHVQCI